MNRHREIHPADARVPAFETWPEPGISGLIGSGPNAGQPVLARRLNWPSRLSKVFVFWLPEETLEWNERGFNLESDTTDAPRRAGEGGLIDYLTTALDVAWSTDLEDFREAEKFWPNSALWRAGDPKE